MIDELALPEKFAHFSTFAKWALPTSRARKVARASSNKEELNAFYNGVVPSLEEAIIYLNGFPLDKLPPDAKNLFYIVLSAAEVALYVEWFGGEPISPIARSIGGRVEVIYEPAL